ncbi:hypothetical protein HDU91_007221 [Kappamyces sp. JEL0680]|nr:hypothetical protein HDU91_007221 [Kappamyces sp. JEL0680]
MSDLEEGEEPQREGMESGQTLQSSLENGEIVASPPTQSPRDRELRPDGRYPDRAHYPDRDYGGRGPIPRREPPYDDAYDRRGGFRGGGGFRGSRSVPYPMQPRMRPLDRDFRDHSPPPGASRVGSGHSDYPERRKEYVPERRREYVPDRRREYLPDRRRDYSPDRDRGFLPPRGRRDSRDMTGRYVDDYPPFPPGVRSPVYYSAPPMDRLPPSRDSRYEREDYPFHDAPRHAVPHYDRDRRLPDRSEPYGPPHPLDARPMAPAYPVYDRSVYSDRPGLEASSHRPLDRPDRDRPDARPRSFDRPPLPFHERDARLPRDIYGPERISPLEKERVPFERGDRFEAKEPRTPQGYPMERSGSASDRQASGERKFESGARSMTPPSGSRDPKQSHPLDKRPLQRTPSELAPVPPRPASPADPLVVEMNRLRQEEFKAFLERKRISFDESRAARDVERFNLILEGIEGELAGLEQPVLI